MSKQPVQVSGAATKALSDNLRTWSGWPNATLTLEPPPPEAGSPWAATHMLQQRVWLNVDGLSLNPNRVLLSATPFRLRQEAVLTGALLHEAAHARFTTWKPYTEEERAEFKHPDGKEVSQAEMALAMLMEEPRIEGRMYAEAKRTGCSGLEWTMQAMAVHLFPLTVEATDPGQEIMNLIGAWALRAGRATARGSARLTPTPKWATKFNIVLGNAIRRYREDQGDDWAQACDTETQVLKQLLDMLVWRERSYASAGATHQVELARKILNLLFPETPDGEGPTPDVGGCSMLAGAGESGDEDGDEPREGDGSSEGEEGESPSKSALAEAIKEILEESKGSAEAEAKKEMAANPPPAESTSSQGAGAKQRVVGSTITGFLPPSPSDRAVAKSAEKFLRDLVNPTETSATAVTDAPSATIDATALSVWKAGGRRSAPRFFSQTRRDVQPAPPVKIAVLVDISLSMGVLAKPSGLLSWALANAAVDMRNFAGRGTQVESTLIHWGDRAVVIQKNGETLPGVGNHACPDGTTAMGAGLALVDEQIPGFFDLKDSGQEENRLIIQFTDWGLSSERRVHEHASAWVNRALSSGVKMLTIHPSQTIDWVLNIRHNIIDPSLAHRHVMVPYTGDDEKVWTAAAAALR